MQKPRKACRVTRLQQQPSVPAEVTHEPFAAQKQTFEPAKRTHPVLQLGVEANDVPSVTGVRPGNIHLVDGAIRGVEQRARANHTQHEEANAAEERLYAAPLGVELELVAVVAQVSTTL